ncbi:hypothetical protein BU15DRAFT_90808 [Melanogaster broomeanus]|nr:hypothetical protein BU15DRAFT_90808 [Melanogaster broomeanus]
MVPSTSHLHSSPGPGSWLPASEFWAVADYLEEQEADHDLPLPPDPGRHTQHHRKKLIQWRRWSEDVIPSMKSFYLTYLRKSLFLWHEVQLPLPLCESGCDLRCIVICCVGMNGIHSLELDMCHCCPAAQQLLARRFFPCAPIAPSLAVSLPLLALVHEIFVCMPPNMSAWCEAFEAALHSRGHTIVAKEGIRRRFSAAYHWYVVLALTVDESIGTLLQSRDASCALDDELSHGQPDEYLQARCPLSYSPDAIVCIDACFTQKRWQKDDVDDPCNPTQTFFLSDHEVMSMELTADARPPTVDEEDGYEPGMRVPTSVLEGCNESFLAANECREKASTHFFADTRIMALLCRHDQVLWLVNMTSTGEKQHYALALLHQFFQHINEAFTLSLLYDIGCQLEHSCRKWGFLAAYLPRIRFGISVFHAFGHQWPCQLLYHPHKCVGFGLSDGEGCERFWSAIQPLIPSLHTSGVLAHLDKKSLIGLGQWLKRWWNYCQEKKEHAKSCLEELGWSMETLKAKWLAQVMEQTKPAPCRTKNKGAQAVKEIIQWENALEANHSIMMDLTKAMANRNGNPTELTMQLNETTARDTKLKNDIRIGKARLGAHMNAHALIQRLRDCLRQHKFELEKLERSYRQTINDHKLRVHTEWSGHAPRGATPPNPIARDGLFLLDVDDNIWQDIGLYDEDDSVHPPAWLADEKYDRCIEEQLRLTKERCLLQEYMLEEWTRAETLCRETGTLSFSTL